MPEATQKGTADKRERRPKRSGAQKGAAPKKERRMKITLHPPQIIADSTPRRPIQLIGLPTQAIK
jgi:hypothetical protein